MSIKSAERTLLLLEVVSKRQPISMRELRDDLKIPRSSLHGLLAVMAGSGFLAVSPDGDYSIGLRAFEVGAVWTQSIDIESAGVPVLRRLVDDVEQIAHVGVLDGNDVVYVLKQENARPVRLASAVGRRLPVHATALGKVLLTGVDEEGIRARFPERTLPVMTPATPATVDELVAAVDEVRRTGLSVDRGESTPGVTCYAAPIYGRGDVLVAAVSISVIDATGSDREPASYGQAVRQAAAEISLALGSQERDR